jgi:hypothetical protein
MPATITSPLMFDYLTLAQELSLSQKEIAMLEEQVQREFPHDDMLRELHLLRAVDAYASKSLYAIP